MEMGHVTQAISWFQKALDTLGPEVEKDMMLTNESFPVAEAMARLGILKYGVRL